MNVETIREYCLSKKGVTESFPFDDVSLVMKVMDKMFVQSKGNCHLKRWASVQLIRAGCVFLLFFHNESILSFPMS